MERRMERLTADKLDAFIDLRLTQLKEEGTLETDLRPALEDYLHRHLADGSFVSWILTEGNRILKEYGAPEALIHAVVSHGYQIGTDVEPEHMMEKVLYATDELTGLIGAVALMRPSKSVSDLETRSVRKKYKSKGFAEGCSREVIQRGADMLGWGLDELIERTILAMRSCEDAYSQFQ